MPTIASVCIYFTDTETRYTTAVQNILKPFGKVYDWSIKVQIMGLTGVEASKKMVELLDLPISWEEYYALAQEQYKYLMPDAQLMPGMFDVNLYLFRRFRYGKYL